jgi:hypothetical protein
VQIPQATPMSRFNLRRNASPVVTALLCLLPLCLLPCSLTHATESKKQTTRATVNAKPTIKTIHWPVISWGFKDRLTWLRDTTVNGLLPRHTTGAKKLTWDDGTALQFDVDRQLFKSIRQDTYSDSLKQTLNQPNGLQVGNNTQVQWDVQRFWTVDDRQEVAVKLGLHFDFR